MVWSVWVSDSGAGECEKNAKIMVPAAGPECETNAKIMRDHYFHIFFTFEQNAKKM